MLDRAVEKALRTPCRICAVEIEAYAIGNLVEKAQTGQLALDAVWPDVKTFPYRQAYGCYDVLTAGFPCQPFSCAGKGLATNDSRHLWPFIADGIRLCRPPLVFLENVPGIITAKCVDGTPVLLYVLRDLEERGYAAAWGLYSAEEIGAPHKRQRVFILGLENAQFQRWRGRFYGKSSCRGQGWSLQTQRSGQLGDTEYLRCNAGYVGDLHPEETTQRPHGRIADRYGQLAHPPQQRLEGNRPEGKQEPAGHEKEALSVCGCGRWPARPGQEQFGWEPPRTVKPGLGRGADGMACRLDRLRLTGNGIVQQTAEKAFRELLVRLFMESRL